MRELLDVTDIAARLIAKKIENFEPTRFQPVGDHSPVTSGRVVFKTQQANSISVRRVIQHLESADSIGRLEVRGIDAPEFVVFSRQRGIPARLRVAELNEVHVGNPFGLKPLTEPVFREALLFREAATARTSASTVMPT